MAEVDRQIRLIAEFVELEAREKSAEIRARAKADADAERQIALVNAREKLGEEFDRKEKALGVELKINASMAEARQRSRLLAAREQYVDKLSKEAAARLRAAIAGDKARYPALLMGLIKQAMARLTGEQACEVRCRPADLELARQATAAAAEKIKAAGGPALATTVTADAALADSMGGVIVTAMAGRIRCNNTLEARLETVLHDLTPVVRDTLFPSARAEVKTKPAVYFPHQQAHGTAAPHQPQCCVPDAPAAAVATPAAAAPAAAAPAPAAPAAAAAAAAAPAPAAAPAAAKAAAPAAADPFAF